MREWVARQRATGWPAISAARSWLGRVWSGAPGTISDQASLRFAVQLGLEGRNGGRAARILFTSPGAAELIRNAAQDLAYTLAEQMGRRVLLVEADLGDTRPSTAPGLRELLVHGTEGLPAAVRPTEHPRVFLLPVGSSGLAAAALPAAGFGPLLEEAGSDFDCVILMAAPVVGDPRSLAFARLVDHTLVFAYEGETSVAEIESSLALLRECDAAGVGVVLAREAPPEPVPMG